MSALQTPAPPSSSQEDGAGPAARTPRRQTLATGWTATPARRQHLVHAQAARLAHADKRRKHYARLRTQQNLTIAQAAAELGVTYRTARRYERHMREAGPVLTPRQAAALTAIATGTPQRAAARRLGITDRTLRRNAAEAAAELGAVSLVHAVAVAAAAGLIDPASIRDRTLPVWPDLEDA